MIPTTQATVEAAAFILRQLFDRATDPALTYAHVEAAVDDIARRFDAAGLRAVAQAFGCRFGLTSKAAARQRILNRIAQRTERHERGEVTAQVVRGDRLPLRPPGTRQATDNATGEAS